MKRKLPAGIGFILGILFINQGWSQSDIESARTSVVKIETTFTVKDKNGKSETRAGTATGFCWQDPMYVVTALHAVAGVSDIKIIKNDGSSTKARVEKVLLEADLALLRLTSSLALKPLALAEVSPNSGKSYTIWGFPHAVYKIQDNEVRLSRSLEAWPTLNDIINGDVLKYQLEKQKYPSTRANILKIGSTIQPGQSGAPLFTTDGKVVGVADGGLRGGAALLNWGMPAARYVPKLTTSADPIPNVVSLQSSLYSTSTALPLGAGDADISAYIEQDARENTVVMGNTSITRTWTAGFDDILGTMSYAEAKELRDMVAEFGLNMSDTQYDIYEDFETGATVAIPNGENFDVKDGWYYTCNSTNDLCYYVLPFDGGTFEKARAQAINFFTSSFPDQSWSPIADSPDEISEKLSDEEATYTFYRASNDGSGNIVEFTIEIYGQDMLIAFMIYNANRLENSAYLKNFFHFSLAMELRDFANYDDE